MKRAQPITPAVVIDMIEVLQDAAQLLLDRTPITPGSDIAGSIITLAKVYGPQLGHLSSDGCWVDGPPGPACRCQSCRSAT